MLQVKTPTSDKPAQKERVIIIGSGPAGFTAGIYLARANLEPLMLEGFMSGGMPGGQLMTTAEVENYPGFPDGVDGQTLMGEMRKHAVNAGVRMVMTDATEIDLSQRPFKLTDMSGVKYEADTVIVATGANARRLDMDSEKEFWMKGISACAVCDGALPIFRDKPLAVIGGGDTAIEEAEHLTKFGSKVYIIHRRDEFRASKILQKRAMDHPKIEILWNKVPEEFYGDKVLGGIKLKDTATGEITDIEVSGCFEAIGHITNVNFLNGQVELDNGGYIKTSNATSTSVGGVFAAGDVQDPIYRQAVVAAGSGAQAALDCERWLLENE
jgi:thioredoxin reductase (NADPH)